jgi:hypothetical protein
VARHGPVKVAEFDHHLSGTYINIKNITVNVVKLRRDMGFDLVRLLLASGSGLFCFSVILWFPLFMYS